MELVSFRMLAPTYNSQSTYVPSSYGTPARTHYVADPIKTRLSMEYPYNLHGSPEPSREEPQPERPASPKGINPLTGRSIPPFLMHGTGGGGGSPLGPGLGVSAWL